MKSAPALPPIPTAPRPRIEAGRPFGVIISPDGVADLAPSCKARGIRVAVAKSSAPNRCDWFTHPYKFLAASAGMERL